MQELKSWMTQYESKIKEDLYAFLRFQTISSDPGFLKEHRSCCEWIASFFSRYQIQNEIIETCGLPLVFAEDVSAPPDAPTLLIYGHYDVQPVDPIELWESDPFNPVEKNGQIYARGALDDKGQIFYAMAAVCALKERLGGTLPIRIKFCIEGEEESGSEGLSDLLQKEKERFLANSLLVVDCSMPNLSTPAVTLGARGIVTMELCLKGSMTDLHSGLFGGAALNPNQALVQMLSSCFDEKGDVAIPGFYDDVFHLSEEQKKQFSYPEDRKSLEEAGVFALKAQEKLPGCAIALKPTLEINGISGGYAKEGFKTVIPSQAIAKLSCRLVPNQDPRKIGELVTQFLKKCAPNGLEVHADVLQWGRAFRGDPNSSLAQALRLSYKRIFANDPLFLLTGGSIPVIADLAQAAQADVAGMGFGIASDQMHAPNEHFGWDRFQKGFLTVGGVIEYLGKR